MDNIQNSETNRYFQAMSRNDLTTLVAIEKRHDLYGYPPNIVSIGLAAFDAGEDVCEALDRYMFPEDFEDDDRKDPTCATSK